VKLVADPSQGSEIERVGKAQNVYDTAMAQAAAGQNITNLRAATINLYKAQGVPDEEIAILCPEPDPNAPPPKEMQLMLAQQAFEAELRQKELQLKEQEIQQKAERLRLDGLKQAHLAAKELSELGLKADLDEATITEKYANALKGLVKDAGLTYEQAKREVTNIESEFIDNEGAANAAQAGNTGAAGNLAL
jgi:DNA-binding transcriptional MerR regulator